MQVKKQQLELDMEQQTDFKQGMSTSKVYIITLLIYMQSISCEMKGWMKHKLRLRLPGEISVTSDTEMTPHLWQKTKN